MRQVSAETMIPKRTSNFYLNPQEQIVSVILIQFVPLSFEFRWAEVFLIPSKLFLSVFLWIIFHLPFLVVSVMLRLIHLSLFLPGLFVFFLWSPTFIFPFFISIFQSPSLYLSSSSSQLHMSCWFFLTSPPLSKCSTWLVLFFFLNFIKPCFLCSPALSDFLFVDFLFFL